MVTVNSYKNEENFGKVLWEFLPGILKFFSFIGLIGIFITGGQAYLQVTDTLENYVFEPDLIRDYTPTFGNEDSEVTVVIASDMQCPACASYDPQFREIEEEYRDRVLFVHKHYPIESLHVYAESAAQAAQAAHRQDKYLEFSDLVYGNQELFREEGSEALEIWAEQVDGLDVDQWNLDRNSSELARQVRFSERDVDEISLPETPNSRGEAKASGEGIGTPTTIVFKNGEVVDWWTGAVESSVLDLVIQEQL